MQAAKSCHRCGLGTVRPTNLRGRTFDYRDQVGLTFDADLIAPVCDSCGEISLGGTTTQEFSAVLERLRLERKRAAALRFVQTIEREFPAVPRSAWEDVLGVSRGYLSRLASGTRVADTALEILLDAFANEPRTVIRLLAATGHLPRHVADYLEDDSHRAARRQVTTR